MKEVNGDLRIIYRSAFLLRFGLGCAVWFVARDSPTPLLEDALYYEAMGASVAEDWLAGRSSIYLDWAISNGVTGWVMIAAIAGVYCLTAGIRVVPILIAAFAAVTAFAPVLTYRITMRVGGGRNAARLAAGLVTFSPCFVFWAGALYKEGLIAVLLNLAVMATLDLLERWRWQKFLLLFAYVCLLFGLRFYVGILLGVVTSGLLLTARAGPVAVLMRLVPTATVLAVVIMSGVFLKNPDRLWRAVPTSEVQALHQLNAARADLSNRASSGFLQDADISTRERALAFAPIGTTYFLTVPFPWQTGSLRQNAIIPETLIWVCLYPAVFWGAFLALRRNWRGAVLLLAFSVTLALFYGFYAGNIGTAYRMRTQIWLVWAVFAGLGIEAWQRRRTTEAPDAHASLISSVRH